MSLPMPGSLVATLKVLPRIATRLKRPTWTSLGSLDRGVCHACGKLSEFATQEVLPTPLVETWGLTPDMRTAMDRRESRACQFCGSSFRARQLARALVELYGEHGEASLAELVRAEHFRSMKILGLDLELLAMLEACPGFSRSPYITSLIPVRGLPDLGLPFADASLDLVVTSDVLEHIPRYRRVLDEVRRVLRPSGRFVTIQPVILSRRTVTRCVVAEDGTVRHLLPASYHCRGADDSLVFVEFGIDFLDDVRAAGLDLRVYYYNLPADDYTWVAVCTRTTP